MTTNHTELCERLISDIGKAILGEGTESLALVLSRCAALLQSQVARIAELEKERDALKADAEGYRYIRAGRVYIEPQDIDGRVYVCTNEYGRYCKTADAFDAEIAAALQAEKEPR